MWLRWYKKSQLQCMYRTPLMRTVIIPSTADNEECSRSSFLTVQVSVPPQSSERQSGKLTADSSYLSSLMANQTYSYLQ